MEHKKVKACPIFVIDQWFIIDNVLYRLKKTEKTSFFIVLHAWWYLNIKFCGIKSNQTICYVTVISRKSFSREIQGHMEKAKFNWFWHNTLLECQIFSESNFLFSQILVWNYKPIFSVRRFLNWRKISSRN